MLINGRHAEEVRVAVIDDNRVLQGYRVAVAETHVERGNIYRGVIANIEPSLDAAFVEYGAARHGFLKRHDVVEQAYHHKPKGKENSIDKVLQKGQPILVQVTRDAVGNKGAMLTTNVSLAGRYMVLLPFEDSRGVSRKVEDEDLRRTLREKVKNLVAKDFGFIVRTNAAEQTKTDLKADLDQLKRLWKQVCEDNKKSKGPRLLHDDQDLVIQVLRDHLESSIDEVIVDDEDLLARAQRYVAAVMPRTKLDITLYGERTPLFSRYNLEPQIQAIYRRTTPLPSGGSIVIDVTEALTAIDVNSGKATRGDTQQETALNTNLEAAKQVGRQLRLRDIGGLVVVDFIDMRARKHRTAVEKAMKDAMKLDRARSSVGRLSANGLLEINRQRVGQALQLRTHVPCPTCDGVGRLVNPELVALGLVRRIEARAATGRLARAHIALHPEVANAVQNHRRAQLATLERELDIQILITSRADLDLAEERVQWETREAPAEPPPQPQPADAESEAVAEGEAPVVEAEPAEQAEAPAETRSRRKRRRRGGRKKKAARATADSQNGEAPAAAEAAPADPAEESKAEPGAEARPTGKRRSRRGRRRKKPADEAKAAPDAAQTKAAPEPGESSEPTAQASGDNGQPAARRRPRRRRRRSTASSSGEAKPQE